jgi:hypothetical protein
MKKCKSCLQERPFDLFYIKRENGDYMASCKLCQRRKSLARHRALASGELVKRREINWQNPFKEDRDRTKDFFPDIFFSGDCA